MKYKIADLVIEFDAKFDMLKSRSDKYKIIQEVRRNSRIIVEEEDMRRELEENSSVTPELAEYMLVGNTFYRALLAHKGCLLHASAVVVEDEAYLFSAHSGTGKSTHTSLWLEYLADKKPYILNDDKPAIRIMEDRNLCLWNTVFGKT